MSQNRQMKIPFKQKLYPDSIHPKKKHQKHIQRCFISSKILGISKCEILFENGLVPDFRKIDVSSTKTLLYLTKYSKKTWDYFVDAKCYDVNMLCNVNVLLNLNVLTMTWGSTQPTQRHRKDVVKTSSFWSQRRLRLV